jgi:hypothetical protein
VAAVVDAGAGDQHVDPAGSAHAVLDRRTIAQVEDEPAGGVADERARLVDVRLGARRDDDARPLLRQQARGFAADAFGRAGDDADAVLEAEVQGRPTITR